MRQRHPGGNDPGSDREAAFIALYHEHAAVVYGLARRLTGSSSEAEDVTSETFLTAWRRRDQLARDPRPVRPWLLGVAARQALNANRGGRRRAGLVERATSHWTPVDDHADEVAGRLDDAAAIARTRAALQLLSRAEAEALALCVWSELGYAEAASALGVSVATVRTRLARARRKLRAAAASEPGPPRVTPDVLPTAVQAR